MDFDLLLTERIILSILYKTDGGQIDEKEGRRLFCVVEFCFDLCGMRYFAVRLEACPVFRIILSI